MKNTRVILLMSLILLVSCSQQEDVCLQSTTNPCQVGFYTYVTDTTGTLKKTQVALESAKLIIYTATGNDTLSDWAYTSGFQIPLDPFADTTLALFYTDSTQTVADSMLIRYQRQDIFVDIACGIAHHYTLDTAILINRFSTDSALISEPNLILNNTDENVQIIL